MVRKDEESTDMIVSHVPRIANREWENNANSDDGNDESNVVLLSASKERTKTWLHMDNVDSAMKKKVCKEATGICLLVAKSDNTAKHQVCKDFSDVNEQTFKVTGGTIVNVITTPKMMTC